MNLDIGKPFELLIDKLQAWMTTGIKLIPNFVAAIIILVVFFALGWMARKLVSKSLHRIIKGNQAVVQLLERIVGLAIILVGFFIALGAMQLDGAVTSLLAGAGVIGLAIGFAMQDQAADFFGGIILSFRHPFGIGDIIESDDYYGYVHDINLRTTIIRTTQGHLVSIPNKDMLGNPFVNYTWNAERRIDLPCACSQADDLEKVQRVTTEAIKSINSVKKNRPIEVFFTGFGASDMAFIVRFWIHFKNDLERHEAKSDAVIAMRKYFDANDIATPFPIRTLDFNMKGGEKLNEMLVQANNEINSMNA